VAHVPAKEAKRLLRSITEAFESVKDHTPNKKYILQYSLQVSKEAGTVDQQAEVVKGFDQIKSGDFETGAVLVSQLPEAKIGITDSEVMSYLDKVKAILNRFSDLEVVNLELSIAEHSEINRTLREQTQQRYQMSKQLEANLAKGQAEKVAAKETGEALKKPAKASKLAVAK